MLDLPLSIVGKSRMRKRARMGLTEGRSAMVVPTATATICGQDRGSAKVEAFATSE
jgi:hypothetical protein